MAENVRTTKVFKGIERTLNTGRYESVKILEHIEEEITWSNIEERNAKLEAVNKHLIYDFEKTKNEVLKSLNLMEEKIDIKTKEDVLQEKAEQKEVKASMDLFDKL